MEITVLSALQDNYIYVAADDKGNAAVVDPAESRTVLDILQQKNLNLKMILVTHSHIDHTGGIEILKRQTGCRVAGPRSARIPKQDIEAQDGQVLDLFAPVKALSTPGHTSSSVCYYFSPSTSSPGILFTGDTLFINGCGRLLGGKAQTMWQSLQKLAALPPDTLVYCGHEYTEENCRFALTIEPEKQQIQQRLNDVREQIRQGKPTVPSTIGMEKRLNPFLRADSDSIRHALSMPKAPAWQVLAELRKRKDRF